MKSKPYFDQLEQHISPPIKGAVPGWPSIREEEAAWFGLHSDGFVYTHHSSHGEALVHDQKFFLNRLKRKGETTPNYENSQDELATGLFCIPYLQFQKLFSVLENSRGGSILVTGYRGTGKSSMVNYTVNRFIKARELLRDDEKKNLLPVPLRINLSRSRDALSLAFMMLKELHQAYLDLRFGAVEDSDELNAIEEAYRRSISSRTINTEQTQTIDGGFKAGAWGLGVNSTAAKATKGGESRTDNVYSLHEAQQDIIRILKTLVVNGYQAVFILDELDKLTPVEPELKGQPNQKKLLEIQSIVADLKFLLTESAAFHIFIAGKDVDDSWQEDQNKGEGIFESVFVQNIYIPSTFTIKYLPAQGPHSWIFDELAKGSTKNRDFDTLDDKKKKEIINSQLIELCRNGKLGTHYPIKVTNPDYFRLLFDKSGNLIKEIKQDIFQKSGLEHEVISIFMSQLMEKMLRSIGVGKKDWTYNTGLLVLPHLSRNEWERLLRRVFWHELKENQEQIPGDNEDLIEKWNRILIAHLRNDRDTVMTERAARRLRYLLQYLTYKGRGVPRKILREFYSLVQHTSSLGSKPAEFWQVHGEVKYLLYLSTPIRQKLKLFSGIVAEFEAHPEIFRSLDDKGCVATFHTVDYMMKFFQTGFRWADIEYASIMTHRKELFPSRELVEEILQILEDVLLERADRRHRLYMLVPHIKHDLAELYLAFGPEQIELRFTDADFATESHKLQQIVSELKKTTPEERLESFKAQIRLAEIHEHLAEHSEARMAYSKALRWIRMDIDRFLQGGRDTDANLTAITTYISTAVEVLQRLGYIYEIEREFRKSLACYEEAVQLHMDTLVLLNKKKDRLNYYEKDIRGIDLLSAASDLEPGSNTWDDVNSLCLSLLVNEKTAGHLKQQLPFTRSITYFEWFLHTEHTPLGLPSSLNMMAIVLEKMWHRMAANRYLLYAWDFYRFIGDIYGEIDQMILIGNIAVRRREIRLAAKWYKAALQRVMKLQTSCTGDRISMMPQHQSTMKAKLFEYLGDLVLATQGTALMNEIELEACSDDLLNRSTREYCKEFGVWALDTRHEEFLYTLAAIHYNINDQPMRLGDVYLRKLYMRQRRLLHALKRARKAKNNPGQSNENALGSKDPNKVDRNLLPKEAVAAWCSFWSGAEKSMNTLLDPRPGVRHLSLNGPGRIKDRRRFGRLYIMVGRMLVITANQPDLNRLYWFPDQETKVYSPQMENFIQEQLEALEIHSIKTIRDLQHAYVENVLRSSVDLEQTCKKLDVVLGSLVDNTNLMGGLTPQARREMDLSLEDEHIGSTSDPEVSKQGIGISSPLWHLYSSKWDGTCVCKDNCWSEGGCTSFEGLDFRKHWFKNRKPPLAGLLYQAVLCFLDKIQFLGSELTADLNALKTAHTEVFDKTFAWKLRTLYHSELALLGAHLNLDDNIRDIDSAEASQSLGLLYLQLSREVLKLRAVYAALLDSRSTPENSKHGRIRKLLGGVGDYHIRAFDHLKMQHSKLACLLVMYQASAKRFLVNAIDIFRSERTHARCTRQQLGHSYIALGDLMTVRAETLECIKESKEETDVRKQYAPTTREDSFPGLNHRWPELKDAVNSQQPHLKDIDPNDARLQADEAYRDALRHFLSELEEYTKRYRLPHSTFFLRRNLADRRMHFEICRSIEKRHWRYCDNAPEVAAEEEEMAQAANLAFVMTQLTMILHQGPPKASKREEWMDNLREILIWVKHVRPGACYVNISSIEKAIGEDPSTAGQNSEGQSTTARPTFQWESLLENENNKEERWCRFFRSFNDGLEYFTEKSDSNLSSMESVQN